MNNNNLLKLQGEALIPAIAYGDAAGLPVETKSAEYIAGRYGRVTELLPTSDNPFFAGSHEPGFWSDDTQLSLAVAKGLIRANRFDLEAIAGAHIAAYDETPFIEHNGKQRKQGWGGSTVSAMELIKQGVSPLESGTPEGFGNGVLMKMAPLVYWQYARGTAARERHEQYDQLTNMTHNNEITRLTTRLHGDVLHSLLDGEYSKAGLLQTIRTSLALHDPEARIEVQAKDASQASITMHALLAYLEHDVTAQQILASTDGAGFYAPQTLAMAYGAFIAQDGVFNPSVYEAVNLGGDTDSTGSIVAAMSNFATKERVRLGIDHQQLNQLQMLKRVSRQLAAKALSL
ncbi:MAG: ADP-ribosylglycohydrolase family protein [Candidatus Microsaccharimonas sp.]